MTYDMKMKYLSIAKPSCISSSDNLVSWFLSIIVKYVSISSGTKLSLKVGRRQIIIIHNELFLRYLELFLRYLQLASITPLNCIVVFVLVEVVVAIFVTLLQEVLCVPLR